MSENAMIAHAIQTRFNEKNHPTPYAIAQEAGVGVDTVYSLRDNGGARVSSINSVLDAMGLVVVPFDCVNVTKAKARGFLGGGE